jgi:KaiC/GvpD/RAD55 family RecA-like ATPase
MDEYFVKLMSLPKSVLSSSFSQLNLALAMGVYCAAKNDFEKSNQYFNDEFAFNKKYGPNPAIEESIRRLYAWALNRQGRAEEARSELDKAKALVENAQERFRHTNVQASLMTFTHPEVNQPFEVRFDLTNVSRSEGSIVKVENLLVPELKVINVSPNCFVHDGQVELKDKTISAFEVKTVKLTVKAAKPEEFHLKPSVVYVDDLGESKTSSTRPFTITVQPVKPTYEALQGRVTTGVEELDALLFGGIPEHYAVVLTSHSTDEKTLLLSRFLEAGASNGEIVFYVTSEVGNAKTLAAKYPSNTCLFVCNPQTDTIIQNQPNVYKLKGVENLTDIDIALNKVFRSLKPSATSARRICIEILSDVLLQHHAVNTRRWLSALLPTLKSRGFTILAVADPSMHPSEELQAVLGLFDGEIRVAEKETPEGTKQVMKVRKLVNQKYSDKEVILDKEKLAA